MVGWCQIIFFGILAILLIFVKKVKVVKVKKCSIPGISGKISQSLTD